MPTASPILKDPALETQVFWMRYKTQILIGIAALIALALAAGAYRFYSDRRETRAGEMLAAAKTAEQYQQVIAQYPGSAASADACLLLADAQRSANKFAEANSTLETFRSKFPKHELVTTSWMATAANLESMGKADEALATYQRVASTYPKSFNAPVALMAEVPILKEKGRIDEARRVCETVMTQYRESYLATEAQRQLRTLKVPAKTEIAPPAEAAPSAPPQ